MSLEIASIPSYMKYNVENGEFKTLNTFKKSSDETERFLGIVEGYCSTPTLDREYDIISEKALKDAVSDLSKIRAVFKNHEHKEDPVGRLLYADYHNGKGLFVRVGISKTEKNLWTKIEEGIYNKFSIYGRFDPDEIEYVNKTINGKEVEARVINKVLVWEISIVGIPANNDAEFTIANALSEFNNYRERKREIMEKEMNELKQQLNAMMELVQKSGVKTEIEPNETLVDTSNIDRMKSEIAEKQKAEIQKIRDENAQMFKNMQTALLDFGKTLTEQRKKDAEELEKFKSSAKRKTEQRIEQDNEDVIKFVSQADALRYQIKKFYSHFGSPNEVSVGAAFGDLTALPPNYSRYKREFQEGVGGLLLW